MLKGPQEPKRPTKCHLTVQAHAADTHRRDLRVGVGDVREESPRLLGPQTTQGSGQGEPVLSSDLSHRPKKVTPRKTQGGLLQYSVRCENPQLGWKARGGGCWALPERAALLSEEEKFDREPILRGKASSDGSTLQGRPPRTAR